MSDISLWAADYTALDLNEPRNSTAIPYPVDGTDDLGAVLRDIKAVIRQESLNKGWEPDQYEATRVNDSRVVIGGVGGALNELYPVGTAVKLIGASSNAYGWISVVDSSSITLKPSGLVTVGFGITHVKFSVFLPSSSVANFVDIGSALPARMSQWGRFQINGNATTSVVVPLAKTEPNTNYRLIIQAVEVDAGPAENGAYRINAITKATNQFTFEIDTPPGVGTTVFYEYGVFRGE